MFCSVMLVDGAEGGTFGILGGPGDMAAVAWMVGGPRGLLWKSNNLGQSGGEQFFYVLFWYVLSCPVMLCSAMPFSAMFYHV